ncbi:MAG TPA: glycosyltransferase [Gemmatimonadaceae bacterium]|jgi:sugar transferase (PEP-CTERM/EpsH1 system associated)
MKLLVLIDSIPYPPHRGYLQMAYHHIKRLSEHHVIDLIAFSNRDHDAGDLGELPEWCRTIRVVPRPRWKAWANLGRALVGRGPLSVAFFQAQEMVLAVREALARERYDVVVVEMGRMAQYLPAGYDGAAVLNMVDPVVLSLQRSMAWRPWFARPAISSEIARLTRFERLHAKRFDRVLLISRKDIDEYSALLDGARLDWVPYATETRNRPSLRREERTPGMILLSGNMFYAPNVDAVEYFCQHIYPRVRQALPEANLWIVGARPKPSVQRWSSDPTVHVTGSVPDMAPYLDRAMVSICPVRLAIGTQTKVLEAMAAGTPVVTTSAGNSGINAVDGTALYEADSPEDFAARVVSLLNGEQWEELSVAGARFVDENFSWDASARRLESVLHEVIADATVALPDEPRSAGFVSP